VLYGFILRSTKDCNLAAHAFIHALFILRRGLTRFQSCFLGLSAGILLIYWNKARVPDRKVETSHSLLPIICKSGLDISRYLKLATILSLLDHLSHLHHHSLTGPFKASFLLSRKHAPFQCVINRRPSFLQHLAGCHNCLTRCRIQMFLKPQVCEEYGNRTREHQSLADTSMLNFSEQ